VTDPAYRHTSQPPDPAFIDRVYEASLIPERWPAVLSELADVASARIGWLAISNGRSHKAVGSTIETTALMNQLGETGWIAQLERLRRLLAAQHAGFLREQDIYDEGELANDPCYRDYLFPRGLGHATATAIPLPTGDHFLLCLEREQAIGPVEPSAIQTLDELRSHLARSAMLSARLQLERAQIASETLAAIGLPALVLNEHGKVLAANSLMEAMSGYVRWRAFDLVALKDRSADKLLRTAVMAIGRDETAKVSSFPVHGTDDGAMTIAHLIPIRLSARDIFVRCATALILSPVTLPQAPPIELVRSLFDLTAAEARVARSLAGGESVADIASDSGVSTNTVRTHVRGVLEKTGCNRQSEVVAILNGLWSPRASDKA
jgi:DNA-binding CsgD family transcriptional regulator